MSEETVEESLELSVTESVSDDSNKNCNEKLDKGETKSEETTQNLSAEKKIPSSSSSSDGADEGNKVTDEIKKDDDNNFDSSNVFYENDKCFYVDPSTKSRYIWDSDRKEWVSEQQSRPSDNYDFDGSTYRYTDKNTNVEYKWDTVNNKWLDVTEDSDKTSKESNAVDDKKDNVSTSDKSKEQTPDSGSAVYGYENGTHTYTDPTDNTVYIWDKDKNAWFPKVDEDFLAHYQMNYGFVDPNKNDEEKESEVENVKEVKDVKAEKRKAQLQPPTWFDMNDENNTKVYVSNLPGDITEQQFVDLMQKCGLVMKDADTNKMKIKLYADPGTKFLKGDGLCTYIKKESVELALNLLDGYNFKGKTLRVERAKFTMKGDAYDPSLKPKKRKRKDKEKMKKMQEKLFDWRPDKLRGERARSESVVIIKNLFEPSIFEKDVKLILEFQQDLREECVKCGAVKRVIVYDRHPDGVAQVNFKEPEAADACVELLNGRWFNKRKITAETWDGKTKYKVAETAEEVKKRLDNWEKYLHSEEEKKEVKKKDSEISVEKKDTEIYVEKKDTEISAEKKDTEISVENKDSVIDSENDEVEQQEPIILERDSDQETKSSIDSDYTTDEET